MIAVANRLYVAPDHATTLEERFRSRSGLIDNMPGFILNQVLRPTREGDPYIIVTLWESYEHFEMWKKSDAFKQAHAEGMPAGASTGPNHVEIHEVIMDTSRPEIHG